MKKTETGVVVLFILQILCLGTAHSADSPSATFKEELSKQEEIFRSKEGRVPEGYTIDRTLEDYAQTLSSDFDSALANLGPKDRWLDIGAGKGNAILDYYTPGYDLNHLEGQARRGKKAKAVAISVEDRRTPLWHQKAASLVPSQIQYFFEKRVRDYSLAELGRFQVITDLLGGFSYTDELSVFLEKVLGFLELKGTFYTLLQDVNSQEGTNRPFYANSPYLTEISNADDSEVKVCVWLKRITCVEVSCELRAQWKPPIEVYRIHKVCDEVSVPALVRMHYQAGTPPERRYRLRN